MFKSLIWIYNHGVNFTKESMMKSLKNRIRRFKCRKATQKTLEEKRKLEQDIKNQKKNH